MPSATGHYDQNLLADAPEVTGERRREGYTTEILNTTPGKATPPPTAQSDIESGLVTKEYNLQPARALPFWRTRKGVIIIFVVAIVILGAVIGGAVGGTVGKKDPKGSIPGPDKTGGGVGFPGAEGSPTNTTATAQTTAPSGPTPSDTGSGVGGGASPSASPPSGPVAPSGSDGKSAGNQNGGSQSGGGTLLDVPDSRLAGIVGHV